MKKLILAPALAIAMSAGAITPAYANPSDGGGFVISTNPFSALIGLLLPAVQKVREAA